MGYFLPHFGNTLTISCELPSITNGIMHIQNAISGNRYAKEKLKVIICLYYLLPHY